MAEKKRNGLKVEIVITLTKNGVTHKTIPFKKHIDIGFHRWQEKKKKKRLKVA